MDHQSWAWPGCAQGGRRLWVGMEEGAFEVTTKGTGKAGWTGFQKVPVGTERQMYPVTLFFFFES